LTALRRFLLALLDRVDALLGSIFGPRWNPLAQLGALGWLSFWIVAVSGVYLYIFFDTGVTAAYESVESLTHAQWWAGGVMRSLHRYASDALVALALVHLVREFAHDRLRGVRWFAWVTGLVLLPLIYACGVTGYWMVWDRLAQYVAQTTTAWLDALPLFAEPLTRNFLDATHLSGRFFTLMAYIHIAAPLLLLLVMWIHIQRHSHARVNPARGLSAATLGMLLALALLRPALSQPPADLGSVPPVLPLDWFYLAAYPLIDARGGAAVWLAVVLAGIVLYALPWLPPLRRAPAAVVDLANCNGCGRCFSDCPFGAVEMQPRTDGRPYERQAAVDPEQCVACGICVGACPTAVPFRVSPRLVAGIELPELAVVRLRDAVAASRTPAGGPPRILTVQCRHTAPLPRASRDAVVQVPCVGMLPPSFIDFVLSRGHAEGVLIAGCRSGECHFRLGDRYTEERIEGRRNPQLRIKVPRGRIGWSWRGTSETGGRAADLAALRARLAAAPPPDAPPAAAAPQPSAALRIAAQVAVYALIALALGALSAWPNYHQLGEADAVLKLSFSHAAAPRQPCAKLTAAEMLRLPINMRVRTDCRRERWPVTVDLMLDGRLLYHGTHRAAGLHEDGPSTIYRRFVVPAGHHDLRIGLRDTGRSAGYDYEASREITLAPAQSFVVDFASAGGGFEFR
jgi:ferredoxin/coenzyme F420-reducing hydrogenase delta subunit